MEIIIIMFAVGLFLGFLLSGKFDDRIERQGNLTTFPDDTQERESLLDQIGTIPKGGVRVVTPNPPPFVAKAGKWGTAVPSSFQTPKRIWKHKKLR